MPESAPEHPYQLVAELGCGHQGDPAIAARMIERLAALSCVHAVKLQKRCVEELPPERSDAPHPVPEHSFGKTYGEHRRLLELPLSEHRRLQGLARSFGLKYASSVWDITSAKEIASLVPSYIKVPSARNRDFELLDFLAREFAGDLHVSLGMTTWDETRSIVEFIDARGALGRTVFYACVSAYPAPDDSIFLLELRRLDALVGGRAKGLGYSGHHSGVVVDAAALALGAKWIERHFTLDKSWKGRDHAISLDEGEFVQLAKNLAQVERALKPRPARLPECEADAYRWLKSRSPADGRR